MWSSGNGDAATAPEIQEALVAEGPQRTQDGVGVDLQDGREVPRERQPVPWRGFAVGDSSPDLSRDLEIERGRV